MQAVPGPDVQANFTYNSAYAGMTLTSPNSRTVNLLAPNTMFLDYQTQVDARLLAGVPDWRPTSCRATWTSSTS